MEYKRIFRDGSNILFGTIGSTIVGLLIVMLLTRSLSIEDMGRYSLFMMMVNLAVQVGLGWSDSSVLRHGREEFVLDKKINKSFWARTYLYIPILIVLILVYAIFYKSIAEYIGAPPLIVLLVIFAFIFTSLITYLQSIYRSIDRIKRSSYITFIQKLFFFGLIFLVYFKFITPSFQIVSILLVASLVGAFFVNLIGFDIHKIMPYQFDKEYFKKIWSYSWPQLIGFSGLYTINYIDLYVIRKYLTLDDAGIYNVAYNGFTLITSIILIINTLFLPLIIEYKAKKRYDLIHKYISKIPLFALAWLVMVVLGILTSRFIIPLVFSEKYILAIPSFNVLLFASFFYFISICFLPIVNGFDLILYSQIFNIIKALVNIVFDFLLVPKMGIIGAAIGTTISYVIGLLLTASLLYSKRKLFIKND